ARRQARERGEAARGALEHAERQHLEFVQMAAQADDLATQAHHLTRRARVMRAARARSEAAAWNRRLARAAELAARHPHGPPAALAADEVVAPDAAPPVHPWE